jgi:hypothetical protein
MRTSVVMFTFHFRCAELFLDVAICPFSDIPGILMPLIQNVRNTSTNLTIIISSRPSANPRTEKPIFPSRPSKC